MRVPPLAARNDRTKNWAEGWLCVYHHGGEKMSPDSFARNRTTTSTSSSSRGGRPPPFGRLNPSPGLAGDAGGDAFCLAAFCSTLAAAFSCSLADGFAAADAGACAGWVEPR